MPPKKVLRDNIQGLRNPQVKRFCTRAGADIISRLMYEEVRGRAQGVLEHICKQCHSLVSHRGQKTVTEDDVKNVIGKKAYVPRTELMRLDEKPEDMKTSDYIRSKPRALIFNRVAVDRYVRQVMSDWSADARFTRDAIVIIHSWLEESLDGILKNAVAVMKRSKQQTLFPRHMSAGMHVTYHKSLPGKVVVPKKEVVLRPYIQRLIKNQGELSITESALKTLNDHSNILCATLSKKAKEISNTKTLSSKDIQTAVRLVLPGELAKHAVSEGTKAVIKYTSSKHVADKKSRTERANLVVSVSRVEKFIREFCDRVSDAAPVYLAAVVQYMIEELVELTYPVTTHMYKKKRITPDHIERAIKEDGEITCLLKTLHIPH